MNPVILSIGNATKDIFLDIDNSKIYRDEKNDFHYDLTFDDSALEYSRVAGIFGGIVLSDRIFQSAHIKSFSSINPVGQTNFDFENGEFESINRYIISHQGRSVVLANNPRNLTWRDPQYAPSTVYIADNNFSEQYLSDLRGYLNRNPFINIIFSLNDFDNDLTREFFTRASLVFVDFRQPKLQDLINYSSPQNVVESLVKLGVQAAVVFNGDEVIVGDKTRILQSPIDFKLNSFYQASIFKASFIAEYFKKSDDLRQNLAVSMTIANESDFESIIKPIYAEQILRLRSNIKIETLKEELTGLAKMQEVVRRMVEKPKGILAADESGGNIHKKFESLNIDDTIDNRRRYREMLFTTSEIENYLSGVILFEETVSQLMSNGRSFTEYLHSRGLLVGVKLDEGLHNLIGFGDETVAFGLESLEEKLQKYSQQNINFAKWRVAFKIDTEKGLPTDAAIAANVQILARYAKACQEYGIVPIVEPEVIFDGAHDVKECRLATGRVLFALFEELKLFKVELSATILKVNMVMAGKDNVLQSSPQEVARETVNVLQKTVPKELAGIVFLSGGQTIYQATDNLQAITNLGPFDWNITYSYARALQEPALNTWRGQDDNIKHSQLVLLERITANSHALYKN